MPNMLEMVHFVAAALWSSFNQAVWGPPRREAQRHICMGCTKAKPSGASPATARRSTTLLTALGTNQYMLNDSIYKDLKKYQSKAPLGKCTSFRFPDRRCTIGLHIVSSSVSHSLGIAPRCQTNLLEALQNNCKEILWEQVRRRSRIAESISGTKQTFLTYNKGFSQEPFHFLDSVCSALHITSLGFQFN